MAVYNPLQVIDIEALHNTFNNVINVDELNAKDFLCKNYTDKVFGNSLSHYLNTTLVMVVATTTSPTQYPDYQLHSPDKTEIVIMKIDNTAFTIDDICCGLSSHYTPIIIDIRTATVLSSTNLTIHTN